MHPMHLTATPQITPPHMHDPDRRALRAAQGPYLR